MSLVGRGSEALGGLVLLFWAVTPACLLVNPSPLGPVLMLLLAKAFPSFSTQEGVLPLRNPPSTVPGCGIYEINGSNHNSDLFTLVNKRCKSVPPTPKSLPQRELLLS